MTLRLGIPKVSHLAASPVDHDGSSLIFRSFGRAGVAGAVRDGVSVRVTLHALTVFPFVLGRAVTVGAVTITGAR